MRIDILTLFPEMFKGPFDESMLKRAQDGKLVKITLHNLRKWAKDKHKTVDDRPYGGGPGMVLMIEPIYTALQKLKSDKSKVILLSPQGEVFNQQMAKRLAKLKHLILIAGHYEGFDERIRKHLVDEEISIGNYVLTGGELPAMVVVDTVSRLLPGVLETDAKIHESFSTKLKIENSKMVNLLDYPTYTRPKNFKGWKVPKILLSGNHAQIKKWRRKNALKATKKKRPDLLKLP